ncbi:hypothetical protein [Haloarchaeobius iranensis]|uniref:DUF7979 domain-containing protein n=1 Tax=Haloarchaeobius iranensis TaxID=996166 RepID=A0A1G9WD09_9EURY|nr:hypothetical protein [Haloarchaeobius iranensis]SDM82389.1 hypothetical protein SAMN05192554_1084 [Haloarchaeobius iranensis]
MAGETADRDPGRTIGLGAVAIAVALVVFLLGAGVAAAGTFLVSDNCETQIGVSLTKVNETDRPVVEAGNLSHEVQEPVGTAVRENRTMFLEPTQYRSELAERTVQFEGTLYEVEGREFEDCAGGTDDVLQFGGFWLAVLGLTAAALLAVVQYGSKWFPSDEEYRRQK